MLSVVTEAEFLACKQQMMKEIRSINASLSLAFILIGILCLVMISELMKAGKDEN